MQNDIYYEYSNFVVNNKKKIMQSETCTCIECNKTYASESVVKFIYANTTGVCPYCESDLVVPSYFCADSDKLKKWNYFLNYNQTSSDNITHINKKRRT